MEKSLTIFNQIEDINQNNLYFSTKIFLLYFLYLFTLAKFCPPIIGEGFKTSFNTKKMYNLTGLQSYLLTFSLYYVCLFIFGTGILTCLITNFKSLFLVINVFSFIFSFYLYLKGKINKNNQKYDNPYKPLPDFLFEYWCGVEINPTLYGVDLKMFFYQPSLIGLSLFVSSFAEYQYQQYGIVTIQMIVYVIFTHLYLLSHYIKEEFMLSTWDIIEEYFGFMLVWGDMVYVIFWYPCVGWWMADYTENFEYHNIFLLVFIHILGHSLFRLSNWQKYAYKKFGKKAIIWGQPPKLLGGKLLISGFWGIGRHLNYTGEIITYITFSLCSGFESIIPYLLPISLTILLVQRAYRDDIKCKNKYQQLWDQYCQKANFKMVPGVY